MDIDDPDTYSLDDFYTWKLDALKLFLEKRGLSKEGSKAELVALCFAACKMQIPIQKSKEELVQQTKCEYEKLLVIDGIAIPDPLKLNNGWWAEKDGIAKWPPIYVSDISCYFMKHSESMSSKYLNAYKIGKAYEYFASDWLKEVYYHPVKSDSKVCLLRAGCTPSQHLSNLNHYVWACVNKSSGQIMSAYCTCTAGLGQTCNHVAGLIFRVEHANRLGLANPACTSLPCTWNIPNERSISGPKRISEMHVKKSQHGKLKQRPLVSQEKRKFEPVEVNTSDTLQNLAHAFKDIFPDACIYKGLELEDDNDRSSSTEHNRNEEKALTQTNNPCERLLIGSHASKFSSGQEDEFVASLPCPSDAEITQVAEATKLQTQSDQWHEIRKGRITASRFYAVHTKVKTIKSHAAMPQSTKPNSTSLIKQLLGENSVSDDPAKCPRAIKHGRVMEPVAKEQYIREQNSCHINFKAEETGIYLLKDYPYIGASPDMCVSCDCCGEGVLEVKCPLIPPCSDCSPTLCKCKHKLKYLFYDQNTCKFNLKPNTSYYAQIQGQMAATGRSFCDFYVYTAHATFCQRVLYDEAYWREILNSLIYFYTKHMSPYILSNEGNNEMEADHENEDEDMETDEGNTSFCAVCFEVIKDKENVVSFQNRSINCISCGNFYHFKCVGIRKVMLKELKVWRCKFC